MSCSRGEQGWCPEQSSFMKLIAIIKSDSIMMFLNPLAKAMLKPLMIAHNSVCMIEQLPKLHEKPLMNLSKLSRSTPPHATLFELIMKDLSTLTLMKFSCERCYLTRSPIGLLPVL
ncbi:hypothetical protein AAHE18_08G208600 [Arachis hypogaea]